MLIHSIKVKEHDREISKRIDVASNLKVVNKTLDGVKETLGEETTAHIATKADLAQAKEERVDMQDAIKQLEVTKLHHTSKLKELEKNNSVLSEHLAKEQRTRLDLQKALSKS